jgi:SM-20-related protein
MSDDILVVDDFLPAEAYENLERFIASEPMVYGSRSNFKTDPHGHWSRQFANGGRHNLADVSDALDINEAVAPLNVTWKFLRQTHLTNSVLIRCYLNGYTYGTDGYFHTDSQRPDEHTAIIYITDRWEPDWAGETAFLDNKDDIVKSVLPKRNRAVIFPANVAHAGRSVSRKCMILRKTLIFKARKQRSGNFEKLSTFLRGVGAANHDHETGTLHDHLVRTFSILEAKGLDDSVCFGGGLHALYGTSRFRGRVMTRAEKSKIIDEFGERAEELAHLFSILERPKTLEAPLELNSQAAVVELRDGQKLSLRREIFDDLRMMECANLADQRSLAKYKALSGAWKE